jgi:RNA polymerase sigma-70 factor, ECF subfamily
VVAILDATDSALLEGIRHGDEAAFAALFNRHWSGVYRVLLRLVGSVEDAEDLSQEVFLKLYRRPLGGERDHNLGAWLYRVASNLGYNAIRADRRRTERQGRASSLETDGSADQPLESVVAAEDRAAVRMVLGTLSERQHSVLILRYEGLSYAEIATALGVSPGSVGTLLSRAESEFKRRYLEQLGGL